MAAAAARRVVQLVSRSQMRHSYFHSASSNADILITGIEFRVHPAAASLLHPPVDKRYGSELSSIWKNAALRLDTRNISQLVTSNEEGDFLDDTLASVEGGSSRVIDPTHGVASRIKFKRLSKTAKHIMQILDVEAVQEVKAQREIPNIKPGYIVQLKVEVPENKRRVSILKGIVIARRNAGLNTTLRIRRLVAGIGVESVFPLYSPNIKEIKVLDQKKVRRAKLYYLRDRMASADRK